MTDMNSSLERIYPDDPRSSTIAGSETLSLHIERYHFAAKFIRTGVVADIACGSGYGSHLLASGNTGIDIIAVDSDRGAIEYAKTHYAHPRISYMNIDAMDFFAGKEFHAVVSLETIEHLPDPQSFVKHMSLQLAPGGRFIASAPVTPSMDANPFHLHDFTSRSFRKLFTSCGLKEISSFEQVQTFKPFAVIRNKDSERKIRKGLTGYYLTHPNKLFLRIRATIKHGFRNKYLVLVFEK